MQPLILSLGGSLIVPDKLSIDFLRSFHSLILSRLQTHQFVIFTGGGRTAREYQEAAQAVGEMASEQLDWIGIQASRMNATLLRQLFGEYAADEIIVDPTLPVRMEKPITIGAGWKPGWSTDYDAVQVAVTNGMKRVVNLSNITYVYDKDPAEYADAKPIEDISWEDFRQIVGSEWKPGLHAPFDPIASRLASENDIEVVIANGSDLENLAAIIDDESWKGTRIHT